MPNKISLRSSSGKGCFVPKVVELRNLSDLSSPLPVSFLSHGADRHWFPADHPDFSVFSLVYRQSVVVSSRSATECHHESAILPKASRHGRATHAAATRLKMADANMDPIHDQPTNP